jgi:uncharacterized YccA/Bax inhibitor family protein
MMRTANPALNKKTFENTGYTSNTESLMTLQGTVNKTGFLLTFLILAAAWTWNLYFESSNPASVTPWLIVGGLGGFIVAIITTFKKHLSPITAPIYAVLEGLFLGSLSALFESRFPGIVVQAVGLTFGTLFALLMAYRSGLIKATENFKLGVTAATGGICLLYLISFILSFFGTSIPYIHQSGIIGIGFSMFVVVIAALNLVLDFDFIENASESNAPKYMEWYGAFGLLVTLVWLYIEILRLLSKLYSRN